ncbi:MAG: tetratricopeptide repeat protein [Treponema sp.]|nr:tetratricopeptide repeat protein [Treponema sp.]
MAGSQPQWGQVLRNNASGEKPVINEKIDEAHLLSDEGRLGKGSGKEQTAEGKTAGDSKLAEGIRLFTMKRWEESLQEFLLVKGDGLGDEERAELVYYMGLCCTKLERLDDALLYFEQLLSIGGNPLYIIQCRLILAYIYIKTGRAKMAEFELDRLRGGGFESVSMYNALGYAAYVQRQHLKAVEYYEKALDIDKNNATAMNSMGYILVDTGLSITRGLRFCRKAVEKNPHNPAYLDSMGWALYKNGKIKEARSMLRKAMNLAPHEAEIEKHFNIVTGGGM